LLLTIGATELSLAFRDPAVRINHRFLASTFWTRLTIDGRFAIVLAGVVASLAHASIVLDAGENATSLDAVYLVLGAIAILAYSISLAATLPTPAAICDVIGCPPLRRAFRPGIAVPAGLLLAFSMALQAGVGGNFNVADQVLMAGLLVIVLAQIAFAAAALLRHRRVTALSVAFVKGAVALAAGSDIAWAFEYLRTGDLGLAVSVGLTGMGITVAAGLVKIDDTTVRRGGKPEGFRAAGVRAEGSVMTMHLTAPTPTAR